MYIVSLVSDGYNIPVCAVKHLFTVRTPQFLEELRKHDSTFASVGDLEELPMYFSDTQTFVAHIHDSSGNVIMEEHLEITEVIVL